MTKSRGHPSYQDLQVFYGDLHNHCGMSYGHGSIEDAYRNARLQLDFASVTLHGHWPDMPLDDPNLKYLADYHQVGFQNALDNWALYQEVTENQNQPDSFVTFPSFEWHSMKYGDHCIYFKDTRPSNHIFQADNLPGLRSTLQKHDAPTFLIPHHIGYKTGYRGINWSSFTEALSPVAEIYSFHGLSETSEGAYPYLHSMGPRHELSTAQYGWAQGHVFGVIGSTDHHNAHPGSYGYGRLAVWAEALNRDAIWEAIASRRTYALTGDNIELEFALNDCLMGSQCDADEERWIDVMVNGGSALDYVEILHNNRVIHRENVFHQPQESGAFKVYIEVGWGEAEGHTTWDIDLQITDGHVADVEPRFRGYAPNASPQTSEFSYSNVIIQNGRVRFLTRTHPNPALFTPATEGISLTIEGTAATTITTCVNNQDIELSLRELLTGARTFYLDGFVSPAICFHSAVPEADFVTRFGLLHRSKSVGQDYYYVRVLQKNGQYAWSSPIWIAAS